MKKCLEMSSFYTSVTKIMIICYTVLEIWWVTRCNYFSFRTIFCPFTPLTAQKIKILKKWKKHLKMSCDGCNCYFSFWTIFCPFTTLETSRIEILKLWKKHLEILSFYKSVPKIGIIFYTVPDIWCVTDVIVIFHFGLFFALYTPNNPKNENLKKNEKNTWRCHHHFTQMQQKSWSYAVLFLRYGAWRM